MTSAARALILAVLAVLCLGVGSVGAEYGDVVLNKHSELEQMRPVVFSHWFHRIRYRCSTCHQEQGFKMRAGANDISMKDIMDGRYCGMCHNGKTAWGAERCDLCHSGKPGLKSGVYGAHRTTGPGIW